MIIHDWQKLTPSSTQGAEIDLTPYEYRILAHLTRVQSEDQSHSTLASINAVVKVCRSTLKATLRGLLYSGLIERYSVSGREAVEILKSKSKYGIATTVSRMTCAWCQSQTLFLHEHHWPVPQRDGGTETVRICGGCHAEYHGFTESMFYKITDSGREALMLQDK